MQQPNARLEDDSRLADVHPSCRGLVLKQQGASGVLRVHHQRRDIRDLSFPTGEAGKGVASFSTIQWARALRNEGVPVQRETASRESQTPDIGTLRGRYHKRKAFPIRLKLSSAGHWERFEKPNLHQLYLPPVIINDFDDHVVEGPHTPRLPAGLADSVPDSPDVPLLQGGLYVAPMDDGVHMGRNPVSPDPPAT
ncbi:hypothetical protein SODALDRAFT_362036 [Sodiomyces alkalinus F11]|uniref:Uncharacterized protein n=1 Tax=Sodiomyces alkalinus (strain CBS 110278 / VKM F-3762 / F11) TaxID=1314773 RepID=A0A3N2PP29_SODAK|nr:hypothetical protein SODALDRAFT_362036 [Sodiomyces alkalinus F11]ROT36253.1 hypothetical protein SODALDRAFT_362036 [Sodiomyces alkalinus F11]